MGRASGVVLGFLVLAAVGSLLIAQAPRNRDATSVDRRADAHRKHGSVPDLRTRVSLAEGVFLIHIVPPHPATDPARPAYLAYWFDFATDDVYVYSRTVDSMRDVDLSVACLCRDLPHVASVCEWWVGPSTSPQGDPDMAGSWSPARRRSILIASGVPAVTLGEMTDVALGCFPRPLAVLPDPTEKDPLPRETPGSGMDAFEAVPSREPEDALDAYVVTVMYSVGWCPDPTDGGEPPPGGGGGPCEPVGCCIQRPDGEPVPAEGADGAAAACVLTGQRCDDCDLCTTGEVCDNGACVGTPKECDDGEVCTGDRCNPDTGACEYPPLDGYSCPDDGDLCTDDVCDGPVCIHPPRCGDDRCCSGEISIDCCTNPCDTGCCGAECCGGLCCGGTACRDDRNPCTIDSCLCLDPPQCTTWGSQHTPVVCDDGDPCTDDMCEQVGCDTCLGVFEPRCTQDELCCQGTCCPLEPCYTECCDGNQCRWDAIPQPCSLSKFASVRACAGETVSMPAVLCNSGDCDEGYNLSAMKVGGQVLIELLGTTGGFVPAQSCTTVFVSAVVGGESFPGDALIELTATASSDGECSGPTTRTCSATATVTVPGDYDIVEVRYKTFIACDAVYTGWTPAIDFYKGDFRLFSYSAGPSRSFQNFFATVNPSAFNGEIGTPQQYFGESIGYDDQGGSSVYACLLGICDRLCQWCVLAGAVPQCRGTAVSGDGGNLLRILYMQRPAADTIHARVSLIGFPGCGTVAPGIDAGFSIYFRQTCVSGVLQPMEFRMEGSHDGYPWHELYLNTVPVYQYDPCPTTHSPDSLWGDGEDFYYQDATYEGTRLNQWHRVPGGAP